MLNKLRTLIVDDEAPARELILLLLQQYDFVELIGSCSDGNTAIELIQKEKPDLLLLDIQMPEVSGFDVLRAVSEADLPYVIFTTAYDHYAIEAFEHNAIDYLLKPFTEKRFTMALQRAKEAKENLDARDWNEKMKALLQERPKTTPAKYPQKLSIKVGSRIRFVPVNEVIWISAENQYVRIHTAGQSFLLRESLSKLEESLAPADFYRVHRSSIVNVHAIRQIEPFFKGDYTIYLQGGVKIKLSRSRAEGLRRIMPW